MSRVALAYVFISFAAATAWPAPVVGKASVSAAVAKTEVPVGESFVVELTARGPEGTAWTFPPQAGDEKVELRLEAPGPSPSQAGQTVRRYEAVAFALSDVEVPALRVGYRLPDGTTGEAATAAVPLRIVSVLPKDPAEQKLADIRGPVTLRPGIVFWLAATLALLLLAAASGMAWRRLRRRPSPAALVVETKPEAEALQALDGLAARALPSRGDYRAFYIELAAIAKRYLERRLEAPVLEMTSAEAVSFLRERGQAADLAPLLREMAGAADAVKFARGAGQEAEAARHLAAARRLVADLEASLRPAPPAEVGEGVA